MNGLTQRTRYQGVLQILHFNSGKYFAAAAGILAAALLWPFLRPLGRAVLLLGITPSLFWMLVSLLFSHYVYDRFPLYDLQRITQELTRSPRRWINIHSGFDETSARLAEVLPRSSGEVVDIFDARVMTESSIRIARRINQNSVRSISGHYDELPFRADTFDAAFSIFAAHELRRHHQRVDLFKEIARVLSPDGELVLMEHLRDYWNFVAFGPGFLHFFSKRAWRDAVSEAGLTLEKELTMTPFVHVYFLRRIQ